MKKKLLLLAVLVMVFVCLLSVVSSAEEATVKNKIIKLDEIPTLAEIHANPDAYISRIATFETGEEYATWREKDANSVVVFSDLAATPKYYVYPAYYCIRGTSYQYYSYLPKLNEEIAKVDPNAFAGYASIDGGYAQGGNKYAIRVEVPTYVTAIGSHSKFESSSNLLEVYFPTHIVIDPETGLEKTVAYVTSVSGANLFSSCSKLEYIHNSEYLPTGIVQGNNEGFSGCSSLKEFKIPYGVTAIPRYNSGCFSNCSSLKTLVMPNTLTTITKGAFSGCTSLETFVFGSSFTTFKRANVDYETFNGVNSLKFVYMPATFADSITATANDFKSIFNSGSAKTIYFVTEPSLDKITAIQEKFIATKANGNIANATIEKYDPTKDYVEYQKKLTKSVIVYDYDYCKAFYENEHIVGEVDSCMSAVSCTRTGCNYKASEESLPKSHKVVATFVYENGFDNKGYYTCVCENAAYCTAFVNEEEYKSYTYSKGEEKDPIIVFKGYSVPEKANYKGINAGFEINKILLALYEKVNSDTVKFNLLMVNSQIGETNITQILNGEELAENVKGINIKITSTNYCDIDVSVRGFDDSTEKGNFYTLKLITALAVRTKDSVHYAQGALKNSPNTTIDVGGTAFNIVTANNVYNPVNS